jgi:uncharacterized protein (DUF1015 family)
VIKDLGEYTTSEFIEQVESYFQVDHSDTPVRPGRPGEFGMYLAGRWHRLTAPSEWLSQDDVIAGLDITILSQKLIEPILGIEDVRRDPRIDFVGGGRGLPALQQRVDSGDMAVAFSLFPTPLSALIAVSDAGRIMPPKSTWFEPKLADGLVSHLLDDGS